MLRSVFWVAPILLMPWWAYRKCRDAGRGSIGAANGAEVTRALAFGLDADGSAALSAQTAALTTRAQLRQVQADLTPARHRFSNGPAFWRD